MSLQTDLTAAVARLVADSNLFRDIVEGDDETQVQVEGGPVDTIRKAIKDIVDAINTAGGGWADEAESARNTAVSTRDSVVASASAFQTELTQASTDVDSLQTLTGQHATTLTNHGGRISQNETDIAQAEADISSLQTLTGQHATTLTNHGGRITSAEASVTDHEGRLDTAEADITTLQGQVSTLQGTVGTIETNVTNAEADIAQLQSDTSSLSSSLATSQGNLSSLDGRVTTAEGSVTSLDGRTTTAEGELTTLETEVNALQIAAPKILTVRRAVLTAPFGTTAIIPADATIPQNTEGTELLTLAMPGINTANKLMLDISLAAEVLGNGNIFVAVFLDSEVNARLAFAQTALSAWLVNMSRHWIIDAPAETANPHTWRIRVGVNTGGVTANVNPSSRFGGTLHSYFSVSEVVI